MARAQQNLTRRERLEQQFGTARMNLLLMTVLTIVNVILLVAGSESMLLFSASIPYYAVAFPVILGLPELFAPSVILAAVIVVLYLLCWLLSKKRPGWLIVALVLFVLDTIAMAGIYLIAEEISGIMDILFHVYVLYYIIMGIASASGLKKLPPEEPAPAPVEAETPAAAPANSTPIRRADSEVKHRVLLEVTHGTYHICYRRVKRVNELVINGYVYDEYEALMELEHSLWAELDGHKIEAGYDGRAYSTICVDGRQIAKKMRLY